MRRMNPTKRHRARLEADINGQSLIDQLRLQFADSGLEASDRFDPGTVQIVAARWACNASPVLSMSFRVARSSSV